MLKVNKNLLPTSAPQAEAQRAPSPACRVNTPQSSHGCAWHYANLTGTQVPTRPRYGPPVCKSLRIEYCCVLSLASLVLGVCGIQCFDPFLTLTIHWTRLGDHSLQEGPFLHGFGVQTFLQHPIFLVFALLLCTSKGSIQSASAYGQPAFPAAISNWRSDLHLPFSTVWARGWHKSLPLAELRLPHLEEQILIAAQAHPSGTFHENSTHLHAYCIHIPRAQFLTKKVNGRVWHPTCFMDVLISLLPDNLPETDARLYVMQHIKMNPSLREQIAWTTKDTIQKYTPFLIMDAVCIRLTHVTAKMPFPTISCV